VRSRWFEDRSETIGFTHLALGENAVILASEVVGYQLHGTLLKSSML
jgi:hypothetical protein